MNTEVIERPSQAAELAASPQASPRTELSVVQYAIQSGAPVAEVRALVEMQIQMDNHKVLMLRAHAELEREARAESAAKAFAEAMAAFKAETVKVIRNKLITDGPLKGKKHADLFSVVDAATAALSRHGLSATWKTVEDDKDWIKIACCIKHVAGHSEETAFGGPIDTGPGRNAIQARKSSVSYLNRITLLLALGLAEQDADDDGAGGPKQGIDIGGLLVGLGACASDGAALAYWNANRDSLKANKKAYDKFKSEVMAHRDALKKGQQ